MVTVAENLTLPESFFGSITSAKLIIPSSSLILPSINDCFSRAAWYSAFSERSPCSLASDIALIIFGRSLDLRCFNSSLRDSKPFKVRGTLSMFVSA